MTMMHFMRPPDSTHISIVGTCKPFEALVYDHIVHHKICEAIGHYAKSYCLQPIQLSYGAEKDTQKTRHSKNHKEGVILFKKTRLGLMMIFVQIPQQAMHNVFMREPC